MHALAVTLLLLMLALSVGLLLTNRIKAGGLALLTVASAVVSGLVYNFGALNEIGAKAQGVELLVRMNQIREDVYAKAAAVQQMGEDIAAALAQTLAGTRRYMPDKPEDRRYELGAQREQLLDMLAKLGVTRNRSEEIVQPLTDMLESELAGDVILMINETGNRERPSTVPTEQLQELNVALKESSVGHAVDVLRPRLEPRSLWTPSIAAGVARFDEFRRTRRVTEESLPTPHETP